MTELQWLIKTLTEEKLTQRLKDLFIQRLGEVELILQQRSHVLGAQAAPAPTSPRIGQAPSMQKILAEVAAEQGAIDKVIDEIVQNPIAPPVVQNRVTPRRPNLRQPEENVTSTGNGGFTKGPKKW